MYIFDLKSSRKTLIGGETDFDGNFYKLYKLYLYRGTDAWTRVKMYMFFFHIYDGAQNMRMYNQDIYYWDW